MNILLVNLTRFGDLLQSQAAINALAGARIAGNVRPAADEPPAFARPGGDPAGEPRNHVALVCLANFVSAGAFLHNIRHYFPLPKDAFLASLLGDSGGAPDPRATGRSPEFGNWTAAVTQLWQLRERIWSEFRPDLVCNLTPTIPARLLAGYLAVPPAGFREPSGRDEKSAAVPVSGFALDAHGFALNSPWASYMQGASRKRGLSPFNVVDVFRAVAGQSFGIPGDTALSEPSEDSRKVMRERLRAALPEGLRLTDSALPPAGNGELARSDIGPQGAPPTGLGANDGAASGEPFSPPAVRPVPGFVGFQLGASEERRQWPLEYFARLGGRLWRELGLVPVLLGSKAELPLADGYAALNSGLGGPISHAAPVLPDAPEAPANRAADGRKEYDGQDVSAAAEGAAPFISLVGATGLEELAAALCNCALLVSNDTGTMHMAAGLGRPVLGIFLATAQPWDTGPGLAGSCTLEPGLPCHPCPFGVKCPREELCRFAVDPDTVFSLVESFVTHGAWSTASRPSTAGGITAGTVADSAYGSLSATPEGSFYSGPGPRIWLTGTDERGFFTLRSLSGHQSEPRSIWFLEQRGFLRRFLDRETGNTCQGAAACASENPSIQVAGNSGAARSERCNCAEVPADEGMPTIHMPPEMREKLAAELEYFAGRLESLLDQGKLLSLKPLPKFRELFMDSLRELTGRLEDSQFLGTLGFLWRIEVHEQGVDLDSAMTCTARYKELISGLLRRFAA